MISEQEAREAARRIRVAINDDNDGTIDADTAEKLYGTRDMNLAVECGQRDVKTIVAWADQELARRDWQDEPSGDGWYWLEDFRAPRRVVQDKDGKWCMVCEAGHPYTVLCRVCKITERPA